MFDLATPWYDLAAIHFAVVALIGAGWGYMLKVIVDNAFKHYRLKRNEANENLEDLIEELAWRRANEIEVNVSHALVHNPTSVNMKPLPAAA